MFTDPNPTALDIKFRLPGVSVRIHPTFWLFAALFGFFWVQMMQQGGLPVSYWPYLLIYMICMAFSTLIHELGHVVVGRIFGLRGNIVLYSMGGQPITDFGSTRLWQRVLIALAGPAAGFGLFGLVVLCRENLPHWIDPLKPAYPYVLRGLIMLRFMNLFWNLLNLIPVYPLDGGQVLCEVCGGILPRKGLRFGLWVSFLIALGITVYSVICISRPNLPYPPLSPGFSAIIFGISAFQNLQLLWAIRREERLAQQEAEPA